MAFIVQCGGCQETFDRLDGLLGERVAEELAAAGGEGERAATLHVLAAVLSWWADRSLRHFPDRAMGVLAITHAFMCVLHEQGFRAELGPVEMGGPHG